VADRYCSNCGHKFEQEDRFCIGCGKPAHETAYVPTPNARVPNPPQQPPPQVFSPPPQRSATSTGFGAGFGAAIGWVVGGCLILLVLTVVLFGGCAALLGAGA
jgi:hypothetical protein